MMIPRRFQALASGKTGKAVRDAQLDFLDEIWRYPKSAYTFIGIMKHGKDWVERRVKGDRRKYVADILDEFPPEKHNIYFCPNAFDRISRKTEYALPTHYAWCDIDDTDPNRYKPKPNILWETSPGRFQGIWIWQETAEGEIAEQYSRNIVYKDGGDLGGWSITKMLRVPGTVNHKPGYKKPIVTLRLFDSTRQKLPKSVSSYASDTLKAQPKKRSSTFGSVDPFMHDPQKVVEKYRKRMSLFPRKMLTANRVLFPDKSNALYAMIAEFVSLSATNNEIAAALRENPHFLNREGMTLDDLCTDIIRIRAKQEAGQ